MKPFNPPLIFPTSVSLTCGQNVIVPNFENVYTLKISCAVFNGTDITTTEVFKDGEFFGNSFYLSFAPPDNDTYGTYTFVASTSYCGSASAVSRIIRQG